MEDLDFTPSERLRELLAEWDGGWQAFWRTYEDRCRLAYEIHAETAMCGRNGKFSAVLRRMRVPASTVYDMIRHHRIKIGEIEDPDAVDPRDLEEEQEPEQEREAEGQEEAEEDQEPTDREEKELQEEQDDTDSHEEEAEQGEEEEEEEDDDEKEDGTRPKKRVAIELSGKLLNAVEEIRRFYHQTKDAEVIKFCVLRVWNELRSPLVRPRQEPEDDFSTEVTIEDSPIYDEEFSDPYAIPYTVSNANPAEVGSESGAA